MISQNHGHNLHSEYRFFQEEIYSSHLLPTQKCMAKLTELKNKNKSRGLTALDEIEDISFYKEKQLLYLQPHPYFAILKAYK